MESVILDLKELAPDYVLSPEYWISVRRSEVLTGGARLSELVELRSNTTKDQGQAFVLDTGNARHGLIDVPILLQNERERVSAKKIVLEGDVIISRLRPYLMQVALLPHGTLELLGVNQILCSTEFYVLRSSSGESIASLVPWLLSNDVQSMLGDAATGGHHPRFDADLIMNAPVSQKFFRNTLLSDAIQEVSYAHLKHQIEMRGLLGN